MYYTIIFLKYLINYHIISYHGCDFAISSKKVYASSPLNAYKPKPYC